MSSLAIPPRIFVDFETEDYQFRLYDRFAVIHSQHPVFQSEEGGVYLSKFSDCRRLLQETDFVRRYGSDGTPFAKNRQDLSSVERMLEDWMVYQDPPVHTRLRDAFSKIFSPSSLNTLVPTIERIASKLLNQLPEKGEFDFVQQVADPLPILVIADLLGIAEINLREFRQWSHDLSVSINSGSPEEFAVAESSLLGLTSFFQDLLFSASKEMNDGLLCRMLKRHQQGELSIEELVHGCIFLIWAGHETTKSLIANGTLLLLQHPEEAEIFCRDHDLTDLATTEFLRYEAPIQKLSRWTTKDTAFSGYRVSKGTLVTALIGAANRDPEFFQHPDAFCIQRKNTKHLSFGKGIHYCLGAYLARTESRILFDLLRPLLPSMRLVSYRWRPTSAFRSLDQLRVSVNRPPASAIS